MQTFRDFLICEAINAGSKNTVRFYVYTGETRSFGSSLIEDIRHCIDDALDGDFRITLDQLEPKKPISVTLFIDDNPLDVDRFFSRAKMTVKRVNQLSPWVFSASGQEVNIHGNISAPLSYHGGGGVRIYGPDKIDTRTLAKYLSTNYIIIQSTRPQAGPFNMLWLLQVRGLEKIDAVFGDGIRKADNALAIVRTHLHSGKDVLACQEELIDAGLEAYADI